ncbi:SCO3242 family prenyltransferase [Streptomyces sp. NPDC050535]|uniref:SCO3242 family prenyltransferase n=1 Tax=Streptomyces sp. NPDC050535 TaxID=3365626 RepID=UPI003790D201
MAGVKGSARATAWVELMRLPALFTVPGDALAGAAAAGVRPNSRTLLAIGSSLCLYEAGMALNDWADRAEDAVDRPHRPLPSGRIRPAAALAAAGALTAAGLALAARAGRPSLAVAAPLAATIWAYDLALKQTPAGPVAMATARGLDLLLGATTTGRATQDTTPAPGPNAPRLTAVRQALPSALTLATHTLAVTAVSREETQGGSTAAPLAALATTVALAWGLLSDRGVAGRPVRPGHGSIAVAPQAAEGVPTAPHPERADAPGPPSGRAPGAPSILRRDRVPADAAGPRPTSALAPRLALALAPRSTLASGPGPTVGPAPMFALGSGSRSNLGPATRPTLASVPGFNRASVPGLNRLSVPVLNLAPHLGPAPSPNSGELALRGALTLAYAATFARPLFHAVLNSSPPLTQRAVGGGIRAMIPLQAALAARAGAPVTALLIAALAPAARRFARKVSVT